MKNLSTYLVVMFMIMYWIFRIVLAVTNTIGIDMGITIPNYNMEIALLFITIVSIVLVIKRNIIGSLLYLLSYALYFGTPLFNGIMAVVSSDGSFDINSYTTLFVNALGIVIPLFVLFEMLIEKNRMAHPVDKKTDWFYKNEEYDRKLDDRADKNNYRTL
jgi:signal transduction histidine kinase